MSNKIKRSVKQVLFKKIQMKKNIFTVVALLTLGSSVFAQDLNQTANWLKNNTSKLDHVNCPVRCQNK